MDNSFNNIAHRACRMLLRPIASMLLRVGVTWKEFSEIAKSVFVEVASGEFGIRGRPTNVSRVSILTGIDRKQVKRQRELLAERLPPVPSKTSHATRVLSGWFQDPRYIDDYGKPKALLEAGDEDSFESLCKSYAGGLASATLLKELLTTGTVKRNQQGALVPLRRYYQPAQLDDENLVWAVSLIQDLTFTMNHNVFKTEGTPPRFGGKAENRDVRADCSELFRAFVDQRGQAFLEEIDDWLTRHAHSDDEHNQHTDRVRLGVGLFAIEEQSNRNNHEQSN